MLIFKNSKKLFVIFFVIGCAIYPSRILAEQEVFLQKDCNIRQRPTMDSTVVGNLLRDVQIFIIKQERNWVFLKWPEQLFYLGPRCFVFDQANQDVLIAQDCFVRMEPSELAKKVFLLKESEPGVEVNSIAPSGWLQFKRRSGEGYIHKNCFIANTSSSDDLVEHGSLQLDSPVEDSKTAVSAEPTENILNDDNQIKEAQQMKEGGRPSIAVNQNENKTDLDWSGNRGLSFEKSHVFLGFGFLQNRYSQIISEFDSDIGFSSLDLPQISLGIESQLADPVSLGFFATMGGLSVEPGANFIVTNNKETLSSFSLGIDYDLRSILSAQEDLLWQSWNLSFSIHQSNLPFLLKTGMNKFRIQLVPLYHLSLGPNIKIMNSKLGLISLQILYHQLLNLQFLQSSLDFKHTNLFLISSNLGLKRPIGNRQYYGLFWSLHYLNEKIEYTDKTLDMKIEAMQTQLVSGLDIRWYYEF